MNPNAPSITYPEVLILEPGDEVEGRFLRLERGHTRDGDERAIAILEVDGAERAIWLHEKALRGQFRQLRPEVGETVNIEKGREKRESGSGFRYWPFRVTAPERPAAGLDWSEDLLGADDGRADSATPQTPATPPVADAEIPF